MRFFMFAAALAVGACQTAQEGSGRDGVPNERTAAARGVEVDGVCFTGDLNGWAPLDRNTVLLRKGLDDWYEVELTGACDADWAFNQIAIQSRAGSSCIRPGDQVSTARLMYAYSCGVLGLYEWREELDPGFVRTESPEFVPRD